MKAKTILTLLFLASIVVAGGVLSRAVSRVPPPDPSSLPAEVHAVPNAATRAVLVAAVPLAPGTLLQPRDLSWSITAVPPVSGEIVRGAVQGAHAKATDGKAADGNATDGNATDAKAERNDEVPHNVIGAVLRREVDAGAPILLANIVKPSERDFLSLLLAPGARAIAITPAAGSVLLNPGDRIDVILMQSFGSDVPIAHRSAGETVAEDIRLLAVDASAAKPNGANQPTSVIIEVRPEQAEKILVASGLGKLLLTLRGAQGGLGPTPRQPEPGGAKPTWAGDVSSALAGITPPPEATERPVEIIRGARGEPAKVH